MTMFKKLGFPCTLVLATFLGPRVAAQGSGDSRDALPDEPLVLLEAPSLGEFCRRGLEDPFVAGFLERGVGGYLRTEHGVDLEGLEGLSETLLGVPLLESLASIFDRGASAAFWVEEGQARWSIVTLGESGGGVDAFEDLLEALARFSQDIDLDRAYREVEGGGLWQLPEIVVVHHGDLLVAGPNRRVAMEGVRRWSEPKEATNPLGERTRGSFLEGRIDLAGLRNLDNDRELREFATMLREPAVQFFLGARIGSMGTADRLAFRVGLDGEGADIHLTSHGIRPEASEVLLPAGTQAPPTLELPDGLAHAVLYRDFARIFEHRSELFDSKHLGEFSKSITDLSLFFGGDDFSESILPHLSPWIRVVSARPEFDGRAIPEVVFPGVALVFELDDVDRIGRSLTGAFQSGVSIANIERAQRGLPALVLELDRVGESTMTLARLPVPNPDEGIDAEHNLAPACATIGDYFVLSSHESLIRSLAPSLTGETNGAVDSRDEHFSLDAGTAAGFLAANRAALVSQAMFEEGKTRAEAERDQDAVQVLLGALSGLRMSTANSAPDVIDYRVRMRFSPKGSSGEAPK